MKKFALVVYYEYSRHVFRWRFVVALISMPLLLGMMGLSMLISLLPEINFQPVGYVDHSGLLNAPRSDGAALQDMKASMVAFESEMQAEQALQARQIQAYFVLEADYLQTHQVRLVSRKVPGVQMQSRFAEYVRAHLLAGQPESIARRLSSSGTIVVRSLDGSRQVGFKNLLSYFAPTLGGIVLLFATFTTSGYLMNAIIEERANRTMEILITSLSPVQLIGGKTIGLAAVGLTQLLFWTAPIWLALFWRASLPRAIELEAIPFEALQLLVVSFLPAFVIIAACMTTLGAIVGDHREGQTLSSLFFLPIYLPIALYARLVENPHGPLALGLSLFPLTSPVTLSMRHALDPVPVAQITLILAVQILLALGTLWLAGKIWRLGMLQYGRRLTWREIFGMRRKERQGA